MIKDSIKKIQEYYFKKYGVIIDESDVNFLSGILEEIEIFSYNEGLDDVRND